MSFVDTKGKFHIALDGVGLILQGAPDRLAYEMKQAPIYGNRFAQGDRSYGDFSFWWFWTQTSWAAGYKNEKVWADDGKFFDSEGVNVIEKPGSVILNWKQLNSISIAKDVTWKHYVDPSNTFMVVGRNNTDQKMRASNVFDGSTIWEDTAVGANERINCAEKAGNTAYIGCQTVGSGASTFKSSTGGAFSDIGAFTSSILNIVYYPDTDRFFIFTTSDGLYENVRGTTTFTQKKTGYPIGLTGGNFSFGEGVGQGAWLIGDRIYFTLSQANVWRSQLWAYDIGDDLYVHIYDFQPGVNPTKLIAGTNGNLYLFDQNNNIGRLQIWKYSPSTGVMTRLFEIGRDTGSSNNIANPVKDAESIYFVVDDGTSDYQIWQLDRNDVLFSGITPPAAYAADIDMLAMSDTANLAVIINGASGTNKIDEYDQKPNDDRQTTGFITTSIFDGSIPALDKLFYDITLNFDTLVSGQSIAVSYSTDGGSTFTSLGSASFSTDGAIKSKIFLFGDAIVSKTMMLKFTFTGGGSNTPSLNDFSTRYVPFINYTKLWNLTINCADEVKRLDGRLVETTARELKGRLERAWWTKSILDFQDLDYATTLLNGTLNSSNTTITVDSTADFPEQGRLRIDNEEITYTGKTPTTFTGCTRGARETKSASHSDNATVNNAYKVILTELQYRVPVVLEDKELEYVVGISLREV